MSNFSKLYLRARNRSKQTLHRSDISEVLLEKSARSTFDVFLAMPKDDLEDIVTISFNLLENPSFHMSAPVFERLAITYRKQHDYTSEVDSINAFLNDYQPLYGGEMWKDVFIPRLRKTKNLLNKSEKSNF